MRYRRLGTTGWDVSAVGMGCWGIGGQWGSIDDATAIRTLRTAVDLGVNLFDTADVYGTILGHSEELVGEALQGCREQVYIATKVGNWARSLGHPLSYTNVYHVYLCCDSSLHRLKTDYIDLYQCHIGSLEQPAVFLEAMERLKEHGKIRAYGISTDSLPVLERFNCAGTCATCQLDYSLLNRTAEQEILPYCLRHEIGTLARGPLAMGLLAGKYGPETFFGDALRAKWNQGPERDRYLQRIEVVERLKFLENEQRTLAQAAIEFVLSHPAITSAIPGAKDPDQLAQNLAAAERVLSEEELNRVRQITD